MRSASTLPKESRGTMIPIAKALTAPWCGHGGYVTDMYALWLDFWMIDENVLHRMGRGIGSAGGGITLQIKKKAETAGELKAYVYLIMDVQLNIQNGAFISAVP